ncbi:hypothetical protein DL96DRAFT_209067 [Flagelloscypha sp. PMI_526]|nr:hypothetical protein DL96DRAFT_209067 [Flagelloscypha sp. PMI_526]
MSLLEECVLAGEPDIYGIGVRIAVYAQNLLAFIPAFWALKDGEVSRSELGALETQSTTILITAFAVLFSAIVQGLTHQINMFHAFIVLELSWMNNTNTFIWFFLYIHHVGWEKGIKSLNPLSWRFWIFHEDEYDGQMLAGETIPEKMKTLYRQNSLGRWPRFVIILGTLHLSLMGAIGIWLWSDPHKFGAPIPCNIAYRLSFAVLGTRVPLFAAGTRILSLLIYLAVLIPVLNIVLPVFFAITVYRWSNKDAEQRDADNRITTTRPGSTYAALILLFAMNVAFVCDIEVTIRRNAIFQNDKDEMTPWTFGQTLALLLLAIPLRDTVVMALTWSDGRPMIRVAQDSLLPLLEGNSHLMARQLIHDGVDPNLCNLKSSRFKCALQLAVHNDDAETIRMYAKRRVEFSVKKGGLYGTAFEDALARGRSKVLHAMMALYEDRAFNLKLVSLF